MSRVPATPLTDQHAWKLTEYGEVLAYKRRTTHSGAILIGGRGSQFGVTAVCECGCGQVLKRKIRKAKDDVLLRAHREGRTITTKQLMGWTT